MSNLLIQEVPLMVLPTLATKIGLNEAMFLQQLHYWSERSQHEYDGHKWVYNTVPDWCRQFPFWSERTLARILAKLEKLELVLVGNYNNKGFDRTKWYAVNYEKVAELEQDKPPVPPSNGSPGSSSRKDAETSVQLDGTEKAIEKAPENSSVQTENVGGSIILPNWQDEENQGLRDSAVGGSTILPKWQDEEPRGSAGNLASAADIIGSMNLPDCHNPSCQSDSAILPTCHDPSCQNGSIHHDNLARPIPENNNRDNDRDFSQRTTTTLRTSQLPMEEPSKPGKLDLLLLSAADYGLSETTLRQYVRQYGETLLLKEADLLKKLIEQKKPIQNPAGWLHAALEGQYEDTRANYEKIQQAKKDAAEAKNKALLERYAQQDEEERRKHSHGIPADSPFYEVWKKHLRGGEAAQA